MISICILSLGRASQLHQVITNNLKDIKDYEVLVLDNGTIGDSVIEVVEKLKMQLYKVRYFRFDENIGVSQGFNYLLRRTQYDNIALWGNDIVLQDNWHKKLPKLEDFGVCAVPCVIQPRNDWKKVENLFYAPKGNAVFGNWFFSRKLIKDIGLLNENFKGYGLEDSEFCLRAEQHGYQNVYIDHGSQHLCNDVNEKSDYREYKNKCLSYNTKVIDECRKLGFPKLDNWQSEENYKRFNI